MRPIISAAVIFLLMVLSISTPATAQEPLSVMPTVILLPESAPDGLKITAVAVGSCVGRVTIETGIQGIEPLEIPPIRRFESVVFYTGKLLSQGEKMIKADIIRLDQGDCTSSPVIHPVKFLIGEGANFGVNDPRLTSREVRTTNGLPWFEFEAVFPTKTFAYAFQLFPNNSNSSQVFLAEPTNGLSTTERISGGQMTTRLPIHLWMIPQGGQVATVTTINQTVN